MNRKLIKYIGVIVMLMTCAMSKSNTINAKAESNPFITLMINEDNLAYGVLNLANRNAEDLQVNDDIQGTDSRKLERTIIAFSPAINSNIDEITRLTLEITYTEYGDTDIFHWFGSEKTTTRIINAEDNYIIASHRGLDNFYHTIPRIGRIEENIQPMLNSAGAEVSKNLLIDPSKTILQDRKTTYQEAGILDEEFYVIMPVSFEVKRVWISIAGYTLNGDLIDDGLGETGNPGIENNQYYIDINPTTPSSVYFAKSTIIKNIKVENLAINEEVKIFFGDYNFAADQWYSYIGSHEFTINGDYPFNQIVLRGDEAIVNFGLLSAVNVRIYYEMTGLAVYNNILGPNGKPQPEDTTPRPQPTDYLTWLNELLAKVEFIIKAALIVLGAYLAFVIVSGFLRFATNVNRYSSSVRETKRYRKRRRY